jgi:hypothetical protein
MSKEEVLWIAEKLQKSFIDPWKDINKTTSRRLDDVEVLLKDYYHPSPA